MCYRAVLVAVWVLLRPYSAGCRSRCCVPAIIFCGARNRMHHKMMCFSFKGILWLFSVSHFIAPRPLNPHPD